MLHFYSRLGLDNYLKSQILISNSIIDSRHKFLWIEIFHLRKSKPLLTKVFDGCTYMINYIINAKETVVGATEQGNLYRWILAVMTFYIKTKLSIYLLGIDAS